MRKGFLALIWALPLIGGSACGTIANRTAAPGGSPEISISIARRPSLDQWSVRYELSRPVRDLVFDRQTNRFRRKQWRVKTSGLAIQEVAGREKIVAISGQPFREVEIELDSYYEDTPKDYEFFQAFSDGSLVMYTGHFNACPSEGRCDLPPRFRFSGLGGAHVIVAGKVHDREADWIDSTGRGTYVYFGAIRPLEQKHLTAIVDPNLPTWLRSNLLAKLPRIFRFYARATHHELTFKPFLFVNYSSRGDSTDSHGGTLPGLIQMTLEGKGWAEQDPDSLVHVLRFFAHEAAHIWNGQLFPYVSGDMWMHEGGADAFSYFALLNLGVIDQRQFLDFQSMALNECISRLKARPLREVTEDPDFKAFYRCGAVLGLITHAAAKKKNPKGSLFSFWDELFKLAKQQAAPYSEATYFDVLDRVAGDASLSAEFRRFLDGPDEDPGRRLRESLQVVGVKVVEAAGDGSREYQRTQAMNALRALVSHDCGGRRSLTFTPNGIQIDPLDGCRRIDRGLLITHAAGFRIKDQGTRAYDEVRKICMENETVPLKVGGESEPFLVSCPKDIPVREKLWAVEAVPL